MIQAYAFEYRFQHNTSIFETEVHVLGCLQK